ncbi:unnamed protein product [Spirodela intermedia]|uniref:Uncharacterized protein n=1 Tax=Spirodela intermedia TaxID=51605 RepID=A0A7I8KMZ1_SPIIN|nr:unnamed protein product [Spirodela intermedia]
MSHKHRLPLSLYLYLQSEINSIRKQKLRKDSSKKRLIWKLSRRRHGPQRPPNGAIALESRSERYLPHPVPSADPSFRLGIRQLVPKRAAGRVSKPVQGHPRRLHVPLRQPQAPLQLVKHSSPTSVDTEVLKGPREIWDVGLHPAHQEDLLLQNGEHEWAQCGDIVLEGLPGNGHEVLGEGDSHRAVGVLLLGDAAVAAAVGTLVGAHRVDQLVLGPPPVRRDVRQEHGGAAHPEDTVGHQHGPVIAHITVESHVLCAHHHGVRRFLITPSLIPNLLITMAESDGVGLNRLQLTITIPMSDALTPVLINSSSTELKTASIASFLASAMQDPDRSSIFTWKARDSSVKVPGSLICLKNVSRVHLWESPGLKQAKSKR